MGLGRFGVLVGGLVLGSAKKGEKKGKSQPRGFLVDSLACFVGFHVKFSRMFCRLTGQPGLK